MARTINIAAYKAPTLWVQIDDLRVPVGVPNLETVNLLLEKFQIVAQITDGYTLEDYDHIFEMFAVLLSSNHNFIKFSADELKGKNITVEQIIGVMTDWVAFIGDLANSKN